MCVFLGYSETYKGYRCLYPPTGRVYLSRHVLFDEASFPFSDRYKQLVPPPLTPLSQAWLRKSEETVAEQQQSTNSSEEESVAVQTQQPQINTPNHSDAEDANDSQYPAHTSSEEDSDTSSAHENDEQIDIVAPAPLAHQEDNVHSMVTRARAGIVKPNPRYVMHTVKAFRPNQRQLQQL